jgi:hypothetical protein
MQVVVRIMLYPVRAMSILIGFVLFVIAYLPHIVLAFPTAVPLIGCLTAIPFFIMYSLVMLGFGLMTLGWEGEFRTYRSPMQGPMERIKTYYQVERYR